MAVLCEIKNIKKSFFGNVVLNDINITVNEGDVVALAGENGAGKSTLLKIMAGAYVPDSGSVEFCGKKLPFGNPLDIQNMGISIIYQEFSLIPYLSVAENIYYKRSCSVKNQLSKMDWKGI
jgi:ABC-type sugar transport system ATPase subunit